MAFFKRPSPLNSKNFIAQRNSLIMKSLKKLSYLFSLAALFSCASKLPQASAQANVYDKDVVRSTMKKVYTWQYNNPVDSNRKNVNDWARGAFYSGVMRAYASTGDAAYMDGATWYGNDQNWQAGTRFEHADDVAKGHAFLDVYSIKKDPKMLAGIKGRIDSIMAVTTSGRDHWWWCDALFMEPPVLVRLAQITRDQKYNDFLNAMWWDATAFLFDKEENLYFRDKSFFNRKTPSGKKTFWSRGNGWVMGGLVQVLERLPKSNASYQQYVDLYKKMSAKLITLQQPDGFWRASLLDPAEVPVMETSGTGFYTFALAWGINNGHLDKATYLPAVQKGWKALNDAVSPEGKLQYVQQIAAKPESVKQEHNQEYGTGAFLMAGTEMMKLKM